jgi:hypothetical protein
LQKNAQVTEELEILKLEIRYQSNIDLTHNHVFRIAEERFNFQVLLDEAEKDFNLLAFIVDIANSIGGEPKNDAGRLLLALAKVERATGLTPR